MTTTGDEALIIPSRFRGPAVSGNGGWTAGALAALVHHDCPENHADRWPAITVTLRKPPPLDTSLAVTHVDGQAVASLPDGDVVARADLADGPGPSLVEPVPAAEARAAMASYAGLTMHPFPTCFSCGTGREEGDGLRILPGRVADQDGAVRVAAVWTPHPSVAEDWHVYAEPDAAELVRCASLPVTWAALDCVGAWAGDVGERPLVLGTMTAQVDTLPVIGEEHVVVGLARGTEGRKAFTSSTLYDSEGRVVARAEHVWIAIDPDSFNRLGS
jgi:hypothetical protein